MPITTAHYTVGTTRVQIVAPDRQPQHVCIHNHEHSSSGAMFIGGSDVTVENGIHAQPTLTSQLTLEPGDALYAIADTEGQVVHVLVSKQD